MFSFIYGAFHSVYPHNCFCPFELERKIPATTHLFPNHWYPFACGCFNCNFRCIKTLELLPPPPRKYALLSSPVHSKKSLVVIHIFIKSFHPIVSGMYTLSDTDVRWHINVFNYWRLWLRVSAEPRVCGGAVTAQMNPMYWTENAIMG